jgi:membrane protein YqaA with SNARE-associated domain
MLSVLTQFSNFLLQIVETLSYFGVFLASFLANASIFFPIPSHIIVFGAGMLLNPLIVGILGGLGAAFGECIGYALGKGVRTFFKKEKEFKKVTRKLVRLKWNFLAILIFAATPLPDDVVGIYCGSIRYPFWRFLVACAIGKIILFTAIAFGGGKIAGLIPLA